MSVVITTEGPTVEITLTDPAQTHGNCGMRDGDACRQLIPCRTGGKMKPAYAIVRYDFYQTDVECPIECKITVKKVVFDLAYAESEVKRLNEINGEHSLYFWQYTRIEDGERRNSLPS